MPLAMPRRRARLMAGAAIVLPILILASPYLMSSYHLGGGDYLNYFRPRAIWAKKAFEQGFILWWNPSMFGGAPFFGDFQGADPYSHPLFLPFLILGPDPYYEITFTALILLAAIGMYRLSRGLGTTRTGSVIAALSYGLSFTTIGRLAAGHIGPYSTMAHAPWVLHLMSLLARKRGTVEVALLAVFLAFTLVSGQPGFAIHLAMACVVFLIGQSIHLRTRGNDWQKPARTTLLAGALGLGLAALYLFPAAEAAAHALRVPGSSVYGGSPPPRHHAFIPENFLYFLVPAFPWGEKAAALMKRDYWHEKGVFIGILPLLCAGAALFFRKDFNVRLFAALGIFTLLDAMARDLPVHSVLCRVLPAYDSFRVPARSAWVTVLCLSTLSGFGWDVLGSGPKNLGRFLAAAGGAILLAAGIVCLHLRAPMEASLLVLAAFLSGILMVSAGRNLPWAGAASAAFTALCLLIVGMPRLPIVPDLTPPKPWYLPHLGERPGEHRVLDLASFDVTSTLYGVRHLQGYGHPIVASLARYYESAWKDYYSSGPCALGHGKSVKSPQVLDRLDVRWIVARERLDPRWKEIAREGDITLFENPTAKGPAFLTGDGSAALSRSPNRIDISCLARTPSLLVVSEAWMPGWKASLDGRRVPARPYENALISVEVPAGNHAVRLEYAPTLLIPGIAVSVLSLVGMVLLGLFTRRRRPEGTTA